MALSKKKVCRKVDLTTNAGTVVDLAPGWKFDLRNEQQEAISFDFAGLRRNGRSSLAAQIRDAVWSQRRECTAITLKSQFVAFKAFIRFLDEIPAREEPITRLEHIDRPLLDLFVGWLNLQLVADVSKGSRGQPLRTSTKSALYHGVKALLVNRQRHAHNEVCPSLSFPRNPFPNRNRETQKREPYSQAEHKRILDALNRDLRSIHTSDTTPLPPLQVLAVHLLVLAAVSGRNLQPLLELRRTSLQEHPLPDRELLVTHKRRGYSTHATSVRKAPATQEGATTLYVIPASVGDHFRNLCTYTEPLMAEAGPLANYAFLWRHTKYANKGSVVLLNPSNVFRAIQAFARRHGLMNDVGEPLALNVARLRPTFASDLYRRTGDMRRVQQALGHASARTTARHYVGVLPEAERNHAFVLDGMVGQFARVEIEGKVLLAADGKIPAEGLKDLLAGGYSTGIARCKNPFREEDSVCKKFFSCFKCPSMLVFEDDLWRLFSFYYRLLSERSKIAPGHWLKTYGPIIRRIDVDIAPQFPSASVEAARSKARETPHPAWR
jgi:integrase